jgi:hypothetical protein
VRSEELGDRREKINHESRKIGKTRKKINRWNARTPEGWEARKLGSGEACRQKSAAYAKATACQGASEVRPTEINDPSEIGAKCAFHGAGKCHEKFFRNCVGVRIFILP